MESNFHWSRRRLLGTAGAAAFGGVGLSLLSAPRAANAATAISSVNTSLSAYDKLVLVVDGQPFYHSGIQFRYDKHKYSYGWTDAQLKPALKMISEDGFTVVNIPIWWSKIESSKDSFTWTELDRIIGWCKEYGLRLELLWFGTDSGGLTWPARVPGYVYTDYQFVVRSDGSRATYSGTGEPGEPSGGFPLLDKTDSRLLSREKYALTQMMNHIASNGSGHTVIGVQILNEPNVSKLWGTTLDRSYSSYSTSLWNSGGYTNAAQFRRDVMLSYLTGLSQAVKQSNYPVYTRSNAKGDAVPIAENERLRSAGKAYLDFFGNDPYTTSNDTIYNYGGDDFWTQGRNLPMIMENYAGNSGADVNKFNAVAGNTVYNMYAALDPDSDTGSSNYGLYNFSPGTKAISRKAVSTNVAALNHALNKISRDLASKAPVEFGGTRLQTFNRAAATTVSSSTKPLDGTDVTFSTSSGGQGIAVKRNSTGFVLLATKASTFRLPGSYGTVSSVESGYYDAADTWVRSATKSVSTSSGQIVISVAAGECIRVVFD